MKRLTYVFVAALTTGLASCSKPEPTPTAASATPSPAESGGVVPVQPVDIGDADQGIWLQLQLSTDSLGTTVSQDIGMDQARKVYLVTATVQGELPPTLTLDASVYPARNFPEDPVSVRPNLQMEIEYGDGREKVTKTIPLQNLVVAKQTPTVHITEKVNLLEHLDGKPTTMLLISKAEIVLHEHGTDPDTIDPATATGPPERLGNLQSNPIRINFE